MNNDERPARTEVENDLKPMAPTSRQTIANTLVMRRLFLRFKSGKTCSPARHGSAKHGLEKREFSKACSAKHGSAKHEFSKT